MPEPLLLAESLPSGAVKLIVTDTSFPGISYEFVVEARGQGRQRELSISREPGVRPCVRLDIALGLRRDNG